MLSHGTRICVLPGMRSTAATEYLHPLWDCDLVWFKTSDGRTIESGRMGARPLCPLGILRQGQFQASFLNSLLLNLSNDLVVT